MGSPSDINNPALACAAPTSTPSRTHGRSLRMLVLSTLDLSIGPSCHRVFIGPEALSHLAVPFFTKQSVGGLQDVQRATYTHRR